MIVQGSSKVEPVLQGVLKEESRFAEKPIPSFTYGVWLQ